MKTLKKLSDGHSINLMQMISFSLGIILGFLLLTFDSYGSTKKFVVTEASGGRNVETEHSSMLDFPNSTKELVINLGSNLNPIMPALHMGPCAHAIAVEPIVACEIESHRQLSVIKAAVAGEAGVMSMRIFNRNGASSSLANIAQETHWNKVGVHDNGKLAIVPVITLSSLLNSVPESINISMLKTDIQGLDFTVIRAGANIMKERVSHIMTEVWTHDIYTYDAQNDLCRDWIPFMENLGYILVKTRNIGDGKSVKDFCQQWLREHPKRPSVQDNPGLDEDDAFWIRKDAAHIPFPDAFPLQRFILKSTFTDKDYAAC